uniref:Uncharacterized protein n=1 Tax=Kalanchoe fedtschenkoi TaxID=63787 RepID=A0A7N0TLY3_KALFE
MGNSSSSCLAQSQQPPPTGKVVILSNGAVHEFHQPLTVAELMLEHPQHVVVEFKPSAKQQAPRSKKPSPLPADTWLDTKNVYLVVPVRNKGRPMAAVTLSSEQVQRLVTRSGNSSMMTKLKHCMSLSKVVVPYVVATGKMCRALKKDCVEECLLNAKRRPKAKDDECLIDDTSSDYFRCRMSAGRGWRPSLDTILEMNVEKRVSHWLHY